MDIKTVIAEVEAEISRLHEVRRLLIGTDRGSPSKSVKYGADKPKTRHKMSAAAKARIREAQKKRWAEWHKTHKKKAA